MAQNRSAGSLEAVLSPELIDAGALLLVMSTNSGLSPGQGGYAITAWPSCLEASISPLSNYFDGASIFERQFSAKASFRAAFGPVGKNATVPEETNNDLRVRQGKTAVRRFGRHNGLTQMITFTYAELPALSLVNGHILRFWKKWKIATGREIPPYVWVPEWGEKTHRLHIHMGVAFWFELGCVNVCELCALPGLFAQKSFKIPSAGSLCIGCLWGRGIVDPPESNFDGRALTQYLTKYIAKDLGKIQFDPQTGKPVDHRGFGQRRFHTSRGHKPVPVRLWAPDRLVAQLVMIEVAGNGEAPSFQKSFEVAGMSVEMEYLDFLKGGENKNVQDL